MPTLLFSIWPLSFWNLPVLTQRKNRLSRLNLTVEFFLGHVGRKRFCRDLLVLQGCDSLPPFRLSAGIPTYFPLYSYAVISVEQSPPGVIGAGCLTTAGLT